MSFEEKIENRIRNEKINNCLNKRTDRQTDRQTASKTERHQNYLNILINNFFKHKILTQKVMCFSVEI